MDWLLDQNAVDKTRQKEVLMRGKLPKHVAIIMDGNGRWAQDQNLPRITGHKQGVQVVRDIVKTASQIGVQYLTLYAFSMENWKRPHLEVNALMRLLEQYLKSEAAELDENNVRITTIGKTNALPKAVQKVLLSAIELTKNNTGLTMCLALSYSSRWDIVRATQLLSMDVRRGKLSPEDITENTFSSYLATAEFPDPDLLIRTSGEMRISNFLLWEIAYCEIHITHKNWPQFGRDDFYHALESYQCRERRFGKTSAQLHDQTLIENGSTNDLLGTDESASPNNVHNQTSYFQKVVHAITKR